MQQPMQSNVCEIHLRPESSLVLADLLFYVKQVYQNFKERCYRAKSKYDITRIVRKSDYNPAAVLCMQ